VRVPQEAGEGKAQIKISFPALKTLKVQPSVGEVVIRKPVADEKPAERTHGDAPR
jgi:hypothetical protein